MRLRLGDFLRRKPGSRRKTRGTVEVTRPAVARPLRVEHLERRDLLAGFSATLDSQGVLRITGTEAADSMALLSRGGQIWIYGQTQQFSVSQVRQIVIDAKGGDDWMRLDSQANPGYDPIYIPTTVTCGAGNDYIIGTEARDMIFGGDGNDVIFGYGGNDYLDGGFGNDVLFGGAGNDYIAGDKGSDSLYGQAGDDFVFGGDGVDWLEGGDGLDWLDGGRDYDRLFGQAGVDYLYDDRDGALFDGGADTNYTLYAHPGWFDMNVTDDALRSTMRAAYSDWYFDRGDVLTIFSAVSRDGTVSATEFASLQSMVATSSNLTILSYVRNLAGKVINGDAGNTLYQGQSLGNLNAGSSGSQLDRLVGKWFLGADRPVASDGSQTYSYAYAQGNLFVGGVAYADIRQGYLGDCYFLTGLGATALSAPGTIQQMFIDNGDGTFTVRFFNQGRADYVTVDRYLPVDRNGRLVFAGLGATAASTTNELWVALAEKAYVQLSASGWTRGSTGQNVYNSISGGYIADAFSQITGVNSSLGNQLNQQAMVSAFASGKLVGLASKFSGTTNTNVVRGHAYVMVGYNTATQTFTLFNPWGENNGAAPAYLTLTFTQLQQNFSYFDRTI